MTATGPQGNDRAGGEGPRPAARLHEPQASTPPPGARLSFAIVVVVVLAAIGAGLVLIFHMFVTAEPVPTVPAGVVPASAPAAPGTQPSWRPKGLVFSPPAPDDAPAHLRDDVKRGYDIIARTRSVLPAHSGNKLDCINCHFNGGMIRKSLVLVGVAAVYPRYDEKAGRVVDLADRTNACFQRALNGKPLPPDGRDMRALLAYYQWISKGVPIYADVPWLGLPPLPAVGKGDVAKGKQVFHQCQPCHGADGQGMEGDGPPLWGDQSFTDGAAFAQPETLAHFVHAFMPQGNPDLSAQQAMDVAAFVDSHSRPHFGPPASRPAPGPATRGGG